MISSGNILFENNFKFIKLKLIFIQNRPDAYLLSDIIDYIFQILKRDIKRTYMTPSRLYNKNIHMLILNYYWIIFYFFKVV